jgi:hypothetical protein
MNPAKLAKKIAREIFTDGLGKRGVRLVIDYDGNAGGVGWNERAAAAQIERVLRSINPAKSKA